ncbi:hypothetical protein DL98DRAFT_475168 [Cadophora sp. DSE1049]|nr:hypothetical protein DL98DRAFT_475168 [Cadophora sp. DSE1049]
MRTARRPHTKSRLGCTECKHRRIKCDESKPQCSKCIRKGIACEYTPPPTSPSKFRKRPRRFIPSQYQEHLVPTSLVKSQQVSARGMRRTTSRLHEPSTALNIPDLELWHHFLTSTSWTFMSTQNPDSEAVWQVKVPQMTFAYPYLMHLFLALSGVHLERQLQRSDGAYTAKAESHFERALRGVAAQMPRLNPANSEAIYIASVFICFYSLGRGPIPGEYLAFSTNGQSEWLMVLRGVRSIMAAMTKSLHAGVLAPKKQDEDPIVEPRPSDYRRHIFRFRQFILETMPTEENCLVYIAALDSLSTSFRAIFDGIKSTDEGSRQSHLILPWLFLLPDKLVRDMERKRPIPLIILAYFAVLLQELEFFWVMRGWSQHVILGVNTFLDDQHRIWIEWPLEQVGLMSQLQMDGAILGDV